VNSIDDIKLMALALVFNYLWTFLVFEVLLLHQF